MSMGLVLHAAWIMTPGESGAPKTDASASPFMAYVTDGIHMFRMQLFFVLAGFFACLLLRRRGVWRFSWNRILRIGLVLVLFWILLRPPMQTQFFAAQLQSGAIQADTSAWELTQKAYAGLAPENVFTMHLWFIYYLFLTYIIVLLVRAGFILLDRQGKLRDRISDLSGRVLSSPWSVFLLAMLTGVFMIPMDIFFGIQIDAFSLYPAWSGLLSYVAFFVIGWIIYRNAHLLPSMLSGWKWQLAAGVMLTVPYYFFATNITQQGYQTWQYPALTIGDIHYDDVTHQPVYPELRSRLLDSPSNSIAGVTRELLPCENQEFLRQNTTASENQIAGLLNVINKEVLSSEAFTRRTRDLAAGELLSEKAADILGRPAAERSAEETKLLNRELLQAGFGGILWSEDINRPYYFPIRIAYSYLYSLTTWCLIFGCIGFSQAFFDNQSAFWRYFSDASYWIYLMHLVVQFQILLWVGDQPWHWTLKFTFYVVGTLIVLVPTYHFLVRPTWLGWLLNGRTFPIRKKKSHEIDSIVQPEPVTSEPSRPVPAPHMAAALKPEATPRAVSPDQST